MARKQKNIIELKEILNDTFVNGVKVSYKTFMKYYLDAKNYKTISYFSQIDKNGRLVRCWILKEVSNGQK